MGMRTGKLHRRASDVLWKMDNICVRYYVAIRHYQLLLSLERYWDALASLDWWLLMSDEASDLPARAGAEHDKLMVLVELAELSERHQTLLDGFLAFGMLGKPRPARPRDGAA